METITLCEDVNILPNHIYKTYYKSEYKYAYMHVLSTLPCEYFATKNEDEFCFVFRNKSGIEGKFTVYVTLH